MPSFGSCILSNFWRKYPRKGPFELLFAFFIIEAYQRTQEMTVNLKARGRKYRPPCSSLKHLKLLAVDIATKIAFTK
jgi:hypothetical protein